MNPGEARKAVKNDKFTMHENEYNLERQVKLEQFIETKSKMVGPNFNPSTNFDNKEGIDWNKKGHRNRKTELEKQRQFKGTTLRNTADRFVGSENKFNTFLNDIEQLPRLSILDNYRLIKKKMNANFIKGFDVEKKYRNRTRGDLDRDPEYAKY